MAAKNVLIAGSGIGGLSIAAALAPLVDRILILERDPEPTGAQPRAGVPHGKQTHIVPEGGVTALGRLFPSLLTDLAHDGVRPIALSSELAWMTTAGWAESLATRHRTVSCSRPLLEWRMRQTVAALPNVEFQYDAAVKGLELDHDTVHGLRLADGSSLTGFDLVIDATGRRSATSSWLEDAGFGTAIAQTVDAKTGYASVRLPSQRSLPAPWRGVVIHNDHRSTRRGELLPIENGEWLLTLVGSAGDRPPKELPALIDFAQQLRDPILATVLAEHTTTTVNVFRPAGNRRYDFGPLRAWPAGLVIIGDAACVLNPVYAQGITVAAQSALAIKTRLKDQDVTPTVAADLQKLVHRTGRWAWFLSTQNDKKLIAGTPSAGGVDRYLDRVIHVSGYDAAVRSAALDVVTLCASPAKLFTPAVLAAVVRKGRHITPPAFATVGGS